MPRKKTKPSEPRPFKVTYVVTFEPGDEDLAEGMELHTALNLPAKFVSDTKPEAKGHITWISREGNVVGIVVEGTR